MHLVCQRGYGKGTENCGKDYALHCSPTGKLNSNGRLEPAGVQLDNYLPLVAYATFPNLAFSCDDAGLYGETEQLI